MITSQAKADFMDYSDPLVRPAFDIMEPQMLRAPVIFNSPHSGNHYPKSFLAASRLDALTMRRSEDAFVDELFAGVVERGAPLMRAHFPRAFLDVNREPYELDPRMFSGRLPAFANTRSLRVAGGLGTIARVVADAEEIYASPLKVNEALARIDLFHKPYHAALNGPMKRLRQTFGYMVLVDCHSMPSVVRQGGERMRADFIIGDRHGTSCACELSDHVELTLTRLGYSVLRNKPYAGGYITEQYGTPAIGWHAIQIEINRALYLDETTCTKTADFERLQAHLMILAETLIALDTPLSDSAAAAAE